MGRWMDAMIGMAGCLGVLQWGAGVAAAAVPSFVCSKVEKNSVEAMVCADEELASLDRDLAAVYIQAIDQVGEQQSEGLRVAQRGWIKDRDDCRKSGDKRACVREHYIRRIAELQARYRLVPAEGPVTYSCEGPQETMIVVTYFATDPPTLIAERGDQSSLMYLQPSGSGARYVGRNQSLWEHQGEAMITWSYDIPEMRCHKGFAGSTP
ncbi:MAG: MliC family protein [Desulfobulbus sp.]